MAQAVEVEEQQQEQEPIRSACVCETYARATERAALAGARWLGRGDQNGAEEAAFSGMRHAIELMPISARIVIGAPEGSGELSIGQEIGGGGDQADLALDPLEGRGGVPRGGDGAMSMIAVGGRGSIAPPPGLDIPQLSVGPVA